MLGVASPVDQACAIPVIDRMIVGNRSGQDRTYNGYMEEFVFYKKRLADAPLTVGTS